jgi:hypothetical protein
MKSLMVAVVGILALAGCAPGESPVGPPPSTGATASAPDVPTDGPTTGPARSGETFVLAPGKAGPFTIGMTSDEALEQGLVHDGDCGLTPADSYPGFSVQFADTDAGDILSGVLVKSTALKTAEGIGVGGSIAKLKETYGGQLKSTTGEYGETTYVLTDGNKAIGFTEGDGEDAGKIFAIDVFRAGNPVIWDGC